MQWQAFQVCMQQQYHSVQLFNLCKSTPTLLYGKNHETCNSARAWYAMVALLQIHGLGC